METTCQQELERKMAGLRNDVQVGESVIFVLRTICTVPINSIMLINLFFFLLNVLAHSVWSMQLYALKNSKMSLILNIKPTSWKVRIFQTSYSLFIL